MHAQLRSRIELVRRHLQSFTAAAIASNWRSEAAPPGVSYPDVSKMSRDGARSVLTDFMNHIGLAEFEIDCFDVADVAIIDLFVIVVLNLHDLVADGKGRPEFLDLWVSSRIEGGSAGNGGNVLATAPNGKLCFCIVAPATVSSFPTWTTLSRARGHALASPRASVPEPPAHQTSSGVSPVVNAASAIAPIDHARSKPKGARRATVAAQ
jgi:hypothetical protein